MVKKINIFLQIILYFLICFCGVAFIVSETEAVAYADDCFTDATMKADFFLGFSGGKPNFEENIYYNQPDYGYRRNLRAEFTLTAPYYSFSYTVNGESRARYAVSRVSDEGKVVFYAEETGVYDLTCYGYSDELGNNVIGESRVEFRSDMEEPYLTAPAMEEMSEWKRTGQEYTALIDWSVFKDDNSGIYDYYYLLRYEDGTPDKAVHVEWKNADKTAVVLTKRTTVWVIAFDKAGNMYSEGYTFDKYDDVQPPMPSYTFVPHEPREGEYASAYEIKVTFLEDNGVGSGLSSVQKYKLNGKVTEFEAAPPTPESIILDKPMEYTIVLYATDNAGNVSEERTITVPYSAFDILPPTIGEVYFSFDLMNADGICTLRTDISDSGESGVVSAVLQGKGINLLRSPVQGSSSYSASFDGFDLGQMIEIVAVDAAGNTSSYTVAFPYYSDVEITMSVKNLTAKFRSVDREEYSESLWREITSATQTFCNLLRLDQSSKTEILTQASKINNLLDTTSVTSYKISYTPDYASTSLSFTVNESDFVGSIKGTMVEVELTSSRSNGRDYSSDAGFDDGFTDFLTLKVKVDGDEIKSPLYAGLNVSMGMPTGYYDRNVALFDTETGKRIETEVVNNEIHFRLTHTTALALAIEGGKAPTGSQTDNTPKTIKAFGNEINFSTFLWIVCGCGGGALLIVIALVILMIIKR